jgi:pilus assembly protein CpaC
MKKRNFMWTRASALLGTTVLLAQFVLPSAAAQEVTPTISVTVNKSMVFRLADRAKRVSVSQPDVADVVVVAPSQLLINGKAVGTTSLIVFSEKGDVANYDLVVLPDVAALRGQFRLLLPNEKVEVATSGPSLVLKGEVSNEVIYDKVLEIAMTYLPPKPPAAVAPSTTTNVRVGGIQNRPNITGFGIAGGGQIAFDEEASIEAANRWSDKRRSIGRLRHVASGNKKSRPFRSGGGA